MATGDYCTTGELKARIWPTGSTPDDDEDRILENLIAGAGRMIDNFTGRRFYTTAADETRYFKGDGAYLFPGIDIVSITTLATDADGDRTYEDTWLTTDYDLKPDNASLDSEPYSWIEVSPMGALDFPTHSKSVKIVGKFGWSNAPASVKEACLLQAYRWYKRKDAPFGMISNPAGGDMRLVSQLDPDIEMMLARYKRID